MALGFAGSPVFSGLRARPAILTPHGPANARPPKGDCCPGRDLQCGPTIRLFCPVHDGACFCGFSDVSRTLRNRWFPSLSLTKKSSVSAKGRQVESARIVHEVADTRANNLNPANRLLELDSNDYQCRKTQALSLAFNRTGSFWGKRKLPNKHSFRTRRNPRRGSTKRDVAMPGPKSRFWILNKRSSPAPPVDHDARGIGERER